MTDRRTTPNADWSGATHSAQIAIPVCDLNATPTGPRDRQLLLGEAVTVLGTGDDVSHVRSDKDGYHGFVSSRAHEPKSEPTHRIATLGGHVYTHADIKSPNLMTLSYGARITAISETGDFIKTRQGFIPKQQTAPADTVETDPIAIAAMFLGTPYLWGGNSNTGIDCSGLVQTALLACGIACPGDSDQQMAALGTHLPSGSPYQTGDLLFWKGHVAFLATPDTLIHANAHHMATRLEDRETALKRIETDNGTPLLAHIRL